MSSWLKSENATVQAFDASMKVFEKRQELQDARLESSQSLKKQAETM